MHKEMTLSCVFHFADETDKAQGGEVTGQK